MYTGHNPRSGQALAGSTTASPPPEVTQSRRAGPSGYNSATVAVAIVVALLLLMAVAAIARTEHRKKKASDALIARMEVKSSDDLGHSETIGSLGSSDSAPGLKEPKPVARGLSIGRRFAPFHENK
ncbi:hypothetical protein LX36DRAFT_618165 [Colletotrichum falcatum]|nr:hypothetical protein LX36DRAFT_618165 [Colletotrichum falcatum]